MPGRGTAFDENSLLLGGASDGGRVAPKALGWVVRRRRRPTPAACATAVAVAATPPREGILRGGVLRRKQYAWSIDSVLANDLEASFDVSKRDRTLVRGSNCRQC